MTLKYLIGVSTIFILATYNMSGMYAIQSKVTSKVTLMTVDGRSKWVRFSRPKHFEAPNWSPDGKYLLLNSEGKLYRFHLSSRRLELVPTGNINNINNDHGISSDGKYYVISAGHIYILPSTGGQPRQVTQKSPSYFHSWSPDDKTLAYTALRDGNYDIYSISISGGEEKRLTTHTAFDDGPDYSPDGKWIYFNSDRSGSMDIWRIPSDDANPDTKAEQITSDEHEDWFPHPSPDGKWLVFLSYPKGTQGHPRNRDVVLRRMPLPGNKNEGGEIKELDKLLGGQGTINVPSWSPDSMFFAYISYSLEQPKESKKSN